MAIFWSSKGDRVKRLLVRRCSHSAQQRQREQLNRDADVDAAIERVKRDAMCTKAGSSGVLRAAKHGTSWTFDFSRVEHNASARTAPVNGSAGFVFRGGGAFSDLRKGHHSFEDPKIDQVAQWRWRFFGSRGKKTTGGSDLNAFPPSDGLTKRRKCVSAAAASSGFARVQDRAATW